MDLYERIKNLSSERKISIRQLEEKLGFGNGIIRRWRTTIPGTDKIEKVADYFGVTTDYLLGRTDQPLLKHYDDKTFAAIAKSFKADNEAYTQLFESLPLLSDEELVVVNNMVQSLIELKQKKS